MATKTSVQKSTGEKRSVGFGRLAAWVLLILLMFIALFPLWIVLKTALTEQRALFTAPHALLPVNPTLANFERALGLVDAEASVAAGGSGQSINFPLFLRNTVIFTSIIVVAQTFFSAMAAYAFARLRFLGREVLFFLYLSALMIPNIVLFIPNFILIKDLGWLDTFQGMVAPFFLMTPFAVFFLRQFFLSVPRELGSV